MNNENKQIQVPIGRLLPIKRSTEMPKPSNIVGDIRWAVGINAQKLLKSSVITFNENEGLEFKPTHEGRKGEIAYGQWINGNDGYIYRDRWEWRGKWVQISSEKQKSH